MLWIALMVWVPAISATDDSYNALWKAYQVKFGKRYGPREELGRRLVWERNALKIAKHNLDADLGLQSYRMALNKFADKTSEELEVYRRCFSPENDTVNVNGLYRTRSDLDLPFFVDWRSKGLVTPVKDQGDCGSCWAFSATGSLEGQNKVKTGKLVSLSEQNLVDCSKKQGNDGCDGGWMEYAFQYVVDNRGLDTEEAYPYRGKNGHCKFRREGLGVNCTGYHRVKKGSESALQVAVATVGPISVAIDAEENFMFYESGIYSDRTCSPVALNHAVLVVGYGSQDGVDYWIVKNSWGSKWGLDGYILMSRNVSNQCGIASHAVFPFV